MPSQTESLNVVEMSLDANTPVCLVGGAGVGKTSAIEALAKRRGVNLETVILSIREPQDIGGLPVVTDQGVVLDPPAWAKRIVAADAQGVASVVFFDEVSTAAPAVQAAMLTVLFGKRVGDIVLPSSTRFVLAMNPPDIAADGWDLAAPLANRITFIGWDPDPIAWCEGIVTGFGSTDPVDRFDTQARALVASFIHSRPTLLYQMPDTEAERGKAWPSPRSWDTAARLLAAARRSGAPTNVVSLALTGTIGEGPCREFLTWLDAQDLPDPEALLADPASAQLPTRGDRAFAVCASVAAAVLANNTADRWEAAWKVLAKTVDAGIPDVAVNAARTLGHCRPADATPPAEIGQFAPLVAAAGIGR